MGCDDPQRVRILVSGWGLATLALATLAFAGGCAAVVVLLARKGGSGPLFARKFFHISIFSGAVPAQLIGGFWGVVTYGTIMAGLVLLGSRKGPGTSFFDGLARVESGEDSSHRSILSPLFSTGLGGLLAVLLVGDLATIGYLVCGWGDAAGELVGRRWGAHEYRSLCFHPRPSTKTLEGTLGVLVVGSGGGLAAATLLGIPPVPAVQAGLAAGAVGAVVEGVAGRDTDNLWVQLLASLAAWLVVG